MHAEIDMLEASIAKLTEDITSLTKAVAELDAAPDGATPGDAAPGVAASGPEAKEVKAGLCGLLLRVRRYAMLPEERVLEEGEAPPAGDAGREAKNARGERPQAQFAHRLPEEIEMVPPAPRR